MAAVFFSCGKKGAEAEIEVLETLSKDLDNDGKLDMVTVEYRYYVDEDYYTAFLIVKLSTQKFKPQEVELPNVELALASSTKYAHESSAFTLVFPVTHIDKYLLQVEYNYDTETENIALYSFVRYDVNELKTYDFSIEDDWDWTCRCWLVGDCLEYEDRDSQFFFDDDSVSFETANMIYQTVVKQPAPILVSNSFEFINGCFDDLEETLYEMQQAKYFEHYAYHEVVAGETVYGISRQYNISQQALIDANDISDLKIFEGTTIRIPLK
jgi:hypothetical protein